MSDWDLRRLIELVAPQEFVRMEEIGSVGMEEDKVDILLVDDDPAVRGLARIILAHEGWQVEEAGSLQEALDRVREAGFRPHLALVDLCLPDGIGTELAGDLQRGRPNSRIVYITGDPGRLRRLDLGSHSVLSKPFTPSQLVEAVRAALDAMRPVAVVIESGRVYRRLIGSALGQAGLQIVTAASLDEGMLLARSREAAVLFTPEPEEENALARLLDLRRLMPGIAVIALESGRTGLARGWYDHRLVKPYSVQAVADAVQQALNTGAYI